jgi:hypothetical protein
MNIRSLDPLTILSSERVVSVQEFDCATWKECSVSDCDEEGDSSGIIRSEKVIKSVEVIHRQNCGLETDRTLIKGIINCNSV